MATQRLARKVNIAAKRATSIKKPVRRVPQARRSALTRKVTFPSPAVGDHEAVRNVLSRYCFALDSGNLKELSSLFHRQADFSVSFENGQKHRGRDTIQSWYAHFFQQRPDQYHYMRHKIYEPLVTVNGNTATSSAYFDAESKEPNGQIQIVTGRYDDALVKEDGQWFFKERTINVFYNYSPGSGQEGMR
jgi:uncharacterized protein (TIGR02246 family)